MHSLYTPGYSPEKDRTASFTSWWEDDRFLCLLKADGDCDCFGVRVVGSRTSGIGLQLCKHFTLLLSHLDLRLVSILPVLLVLPGPKLHNLLPSPQYPPTEFKLNSKIRPMWLPVVLWMPYLWLNTDIKPQYSDLMSVPGLPSFTTIMSFVAYG